MKKDDFPKLNPLVFAQRQFFENGGTKSLQLRRQVLKNLKQVIMVEEKAINEALKGDLGKSSSETFLSEVGLVLTEIDYFNRHLQQLAKPKRVISSLINWPSKDFVVPEPLSLIHISEPTRP